MKIIYRIHAIQRMFERSVSAEDMRFVLQRGKAIETYEKALEKDAGNILAKQRLEELKR